jgi:hypothetical protein
MSEDEEIKGRFRDHLAVLIEGRVKALLIDNRQN